MPEQNNHNTYRYPFTPIVTNRMGEEALGIGAMDLRLDTEFKEPGFSIEEELSKRTGPFLEIGGPTEKGYYFLNGVKMKKRVIMSNIDSDEDIDMVVDGSHISLSDESLGAVLATYMPYIHKYGSSEAEDDLIRKRAEDAPLKALDQGYVSEDDINDSLRLALGAEVYRTLEPGGLFFTDGDVHDIAALKLMGFELKASVNRESSIDETDNPHSYVVLQKPLAKKTVLGQTTE